MDVVYQTSINLHISSHEERFHAWERAFPKVETTVPKGWNDGNDQMYDVKRLKV